MASPEKLCSRRGRCLIAGAKAVKRVKQFRGRRIDILAVVQFTPGKPVVEADNLLREHDGISPGRIVFELFDLLFQAFHVGNCVGVLGGCECLGLVLNESLGGIVLFVPVGLNLPRGRLFGRFRRLARTLGRSRL